MLITSFCWALPPRILAAPSRLSPERRLGVISMGENEEVIQTHFNALAIVSTTAPGTKIYQNNREK